jgi:hypothetical protein
MSHFGSGRDARSPSSIAWPSQRPSAAPRPDNRLGKTLEWVGLIAIAVLMIAAGVLFGLFRAGDALDVSSRSYADATVNAIIPDWNRDALLSRAAPELAAAPAEQFNTLFDSLKTLGWDATNQGCRGQSTIALQPGVPMISAVYACTVNLRNGRAVINLALRKDGDAWKVTGFHVDSPLLAAPPAQAPVNS